LGGQRRAFQRVHNLLLYCVQYYSPLWYRDRPVYNTTVLYDEETVALIHGRMNHTYQNEISTNTQPIIAVLL
jgi:hypothetical protein